MYEDLKSCFGFAASFFCLGIIAYLLDNFIQKEARRQFYRDLVRLVMLYEQNDLHEISIQTPKILGSRIVRFSSYEAIINDLINAYYTDTHNYHSLLAYVLSLHQSYCFSNRDLIKLKNKLLKEKQKNEIQGNSRNPENRKVR